MKVGKSAAHNEHLISCIIPAYNAEDSICKCLDSIKAQTLKGIEIIVVDDGSTDMTKYKIMGYIDRNPEMQIKYIYQENQGPGAARGNALKYATGEYIAFLDSDDTIPFGAYNSMYYTAERWDSDIVIGMYMRRIDNGYWQVPEYIRQLCKTKEGENCTKQYDIIFNSPSLWNKLFRRQLIEDNGISFSHEMHGEDLVFILDVMKVAERVYTTDSITYLYEKQEKAGGSITTSYSYKSTSSLIRSLDKYALYFDSIEDVYTEYKFLKLELTYAFHCIAMVKDRLEQSLLFEELKTILRKYENNKAYEHLLRIILKVDLDTALRIPYEAYIMLKNAVIAAECNNNSLARREVQTANALTNHNKKNIKEVVHEQFKNGEIGFRYIIKYFVAWLKYKVNRGKKN